MKKSFLSMSLLLAITSTSLPGFADTTITGLDKRVPYYGNTDMDITMDDLCAQDGAIYKNLPASRLSDIQRQLKMSLDYMSAVKAKFGELDKDGGTKLPWGTLRSTRIERWYQNNSNCLTSDKLLGAIHAKLSEIQQTYFSNKLSGSMLNVVSLGSGTKYMQYYAALGEQVAKSEMGIVENIQALKDQPETLDRVLTTVDTGDCVGKTIIVTGIRRGPGLQVNTLSQNFIDVVKSSFEKQARRVVYAGRRDLGHPSAYVNFIEWNQRGDIACAMKLRKALIFKLGIKDDGKVLPVVQTLTQAFRTGAIGFGAPGGEVGVNFVENE